MVKKRKKMSIRQRRVMRTYLDTLTGRNPRIPDAEVEKDLKKVDDVMAVDNVRRVFRRELNRIGLTPERIARNFQKLTKADKVHYAIFRGDFGHPKIHEDNVIRLEANKVLSKLTEIEPNAKVDLRHSGTVGRMDMLEVMNDEELYSILTELEKEEEEDERK